MKSCAASIKLKVVITACLLMACLQSSGHADATASGELSAQEQRGKQIYLKGEGGEGEIKAMLSAGDLELPASAFSCANCHGSRGEGSKEGGLQPPPLDWATLTKARRSALTGRERPPYTEAMLARAISAGVDSGGGRLHPGMPQYKMSAGQMSDLIAYLKRVGKDQDPGVTETSIRIGTVLPTSGPLAEAGRAVKTMLAAYFDEVNQQGGIYNRKIELQVVNQSEAAGAARANVERFLQDQQVFAMAGAFIAGADKEIASLLEEKEVPVIGPYTLNPQTGFPLNRQVFYLFPGLKEQAQALAIFAAQNLKAQQTRSAIVYPDSPASSEIAGAVEAQSKEIGWDAVTKLKYARGEFGGGRLARELKQAGASVVLFLGSGAEASELAKEAARLNWTANILLPGALAGRESFGELPGFKGKFFLSFPTLPSDQTEVGVAQFRALVAKHNLPAQHVASQLWAYVAAKVLVEGLKLAGKDLTREKLIAALEGLYEFETGLTARVTFGQNRRVGALGAYVVAIDPEKKEFIPTGRWVALK